MKRYVFKIVPRHSIKTIILDADTIDAAFQLASKEADHDMLFFAPACETKERHPWFHVTAELRKKAWTLAMRVRALFAKYEEEPWAKDMGDE